MANVVVIGSDRKLTYQIYKLIQEEDPNNDVRIFDNTKKFENVYLPSGSTPDMSGDGENHVESPQESEEEKRRLSSIDLVLFTASEIQNPLIWVSNTFEQLKNRNYFLLNEENPIGARFIAIKYEDDGIANVDLMHKNIYDVIYAPIDRLVFLQKFEIIKALPKKISPTHLFLEKVNLNIEVSKRSYLKKISEVGFAILNPFRLNAGVLAHFYLEMGENHTLEFYGKSIGSDPYDESPNLFLVKFLFYGLDPENIREIKKYLSRQSGYQLLTNDNAEDFKYSDVNLFASDSDRKPKNILLLSPESRYGGNLADHLRSCMDKVEVDYIEKYGPFSQKYIKTQKIRIANGNDLPTQSVEFSISVTDNSFIKFIRDVSVQEYILDHPLAATCRDKTGWRVLFKSTESDKELKNAIAQAAKGEFVHKLIPITAKNGRMTMFNISISKNKAEEALNIQISLPKNSEEVEDERLDTIDAIIIDSRLIPEGVRLWKENHFNQLRKNGFLSYGKDPELFIVGEQGSFKSDVFKDKTIAGVYDFKSPLSHITIGLSNALNIKFTKYNLENVTCLNRNLYIHVGTKSHLEAFSEFGAYVRHSRPLTPGTFLFLHGSVFDEAPGKSLCCRFYRTEKEAGDDGQYMCHFTYFGIGEQFLKFVRNWIRENYAVKKAKQKDS